MPRIDPWQLLKCLSVLLNTEGGIKTSEEVTRLVSLMTKFSKKLVSKCIYIQILRNSQTELLSMFMGAGGWSLVHSWYTDCAVAKNWPMTMEILTLLDSCPVTGDRLRETSLPKEIRTLSKESEDEGVREMATSLVDRWMQVVKGEQVEESVEMKLESLEMTDKPNAVEEAPVSEESTKSQICDKETLVYRITIRDGKQVLAKVTTPIKDEPEAEPESDAVSKSPSPIPEESPPKKCPKKSPPKKTNARKQKLEARIVLTSKESKMKIEDESEDIPKGKVNTVDKLEDSPKGKAKTVVKIEDVPKGKIKTEEVKVGKPKNTEILKGKRKPAEPVEEIPTDDDEEIPNEDKEEIKEKEEPAKSKNKTKTAEPTLPKKRGPKPKPFSLKKPKKEEEKPPPPPDSKDLKPLGALKKDDLQKKKDRDAIDKLKQNLSNFKIPKKKSIDNEPPVEIKVLVTPSKTEPIIPKPRPKMVKAFSSKFRSIGIEEEIKPPPSRSNVKANVKPAPPVKQLKRPSPPRATEVPPEKKAKESPVIKSEEKQSATAPKPAPKPVQKPAAKPGLQESNLFMDALIAGSTYEPRKRKRRSSSGKDKEDKKNNKEEDKKRKSSIEKSPSPVTSPTSVKPTIKFYQDMLETKDEEMADETKLDESVEDEKSFDEPNSETGDTTPIDQSIDVDMESTPQQTPSEAPSDSNTSGVETAEHTRTDGTLKGVLVYHRTKSDKPKKTVRWKEDSQLKEIRFIEVDETERGNVTKVNFLDMKQAERLNERTFMSARRAHNDTMEERTTWQELILVDFNPVSIIYGSKSREKEVQLLRETHTLQAIYFNLEMIPPTPMEPELELASPGPIPEPTVMPLDDMSGNADTVNDFTGTPWPDPKPSIEEPITRKGHIMQQQKAAKALSSTFSGAWRAADGTVYPESGAFGAQPQPPPPLINYATSNYSEWNNVPNNVPYQQIPYGDNNMQFSPDSTHQYSPTHIQQQQFSPEHVQQYPPDNMHGPMIARPPRMGFRPPNHMRGMRPNFRGQRPGRYNGPPRGKGGRGGHWHNSGTPRMKPCRFFMSGYCQAENNCNYLHPGINGPMS